MSEDNDAENIVSQTGTQHSPAISNTKSEDNLGSITTKHVVGKSHKVLEG